MIILEGPIGSGKTTLAKALSELSGLPIYRPFRANVDSHQPGEGDSRLRSIIGTGFQPNTWMEDLYLADALSALRPPCILDRSMASALTWSKTQLGNRDRLNILALWAERLAQAGAIVAFLDTSETKRRDRSQMRFIPTENAEIRAHLDLAFEACAGLRLVRIEVGNLSADTLAKYLWRYYMHNLQFTVNGHPVIHRW